MAKSKVKVISSGLMVVTIKVNSKITIYKVGALILGQMAESLMVHGLTIKCMEMEFSLGLIVEDMRVNT